ncbi:MAG: glycosyltransferase family 1 protein [Proteobacteria bacterium]|nr:MAG: glycosyltransferase family 1 protein [Pseudomonadota bacterium]
MTAGAVLLFLVTEDWYFASHRLPLAVDAGKAGYQVVVATRVRSHGDRISKRGIRVIDFDLGRRFINPLTEIMVLWRLVRLYAHERPAVVYHVGMKPVVYGSLAARIAGVAARVNAIAGLGYVFTSRRLKAKFLRPFLKTALRILLRGGKSRVIVQNRDDQRTLSEMMGCDAGNTVLIPGAGVDLDQFQPTDELSGNPVVLFASRMLWDKGVGDFVSAAERLRKKGVGARFVLVGAPDEGNPSSVPLAQIETWQRTGLVEWWGRRDDMPSVFAGSHLVCLPSYYGEGIPKVLIEAAASGRAIVATDIPGCRDIVHHEVNGLLVQPHDVGALATAMAMLVGNTELRRAMGAAGRRIAEAEYGLVSINRQSLAVIKAVAG